MLELMKRSFLELKKPRTIVICGFLLALSLILSTQSIHIGNIIVIGFSFIANSVAGFLFGPVVSGILGGTIDVITHFMNPKGSYFFGFTFNAILGGLIYGFFLYRSKYGTKKLLLRIILAKILISLIVNLTFGTIWVTMFTGKGFLVLLPARAFKESVTIPIHCLIMYIILKAVNKIYYQLNLNNKEE